MEDQRPLGEKAEQPGLPEAKNQPPEEFPDFEQA